MNNLRAQIREAIDYGDIERLNQLIDWDHPSDEVIVSLNCLTPSGLNALMWCLIPSDHKIKFEVFEYFLYLSDANGNFMVDHTQTYEGVDLLSFIRSRHSPRVRRELFILYDRYCDNERHLIDWQSLQAKFSRAQLFAEEYEFVQAHKHEGEDLRGIDFRGMDLSHMYLAKADLTNADLRGANIHEIDLTDANLTDMRIDIAGIRKLQREKLNDTLIDVLNNAHISFDLNTAIGLDMLVTAFKDNNHALAETLTHDLSTKAALQREKSTGNTLLHYALLSNNTHLIDFILDEFPELESIKNDIGETPLVYAAKQKPDDLSGILHCIKRRCSDFSGNLNQDADRLSHHAVEHHDAELLKVLVIINPLTNWINSRDSEDLTLLHKAVNFFDYKSTLALLEHRALDLGLKDCDGNTALMLAAKAGARDCFELLSAQMSDSLINCIDIHGHTALHLAVIHNQVSLVQLLMLRHSTQINAATDDEYRNAYHFAALNRHPEIIELLNQYDLQTLDGKPLIQMQDSQGHTPLHTAVANGDMACIKALLDNPLARHSCESRDYGGDRPIDILEKSLLSGGLIKDISHLLM